MSKIDWRPYIVRDVLAAWRIREIRPYALRLIGWRLVNCTLWLTVGPLLIACAALFAAAEMVIESLDNALRAVSPFRWVNRRIDANIRAAHEVMPPGEIRGRIFLKPKEQA